eukprot:CAMPEP_0175001460 /NCGR_PEP_ID=MMETSP0005-20121125/3143_1 /TAXON_ID=420556 /ORGANISM="Ochromonas sp., Strain CCMP1393" /LENGTH=627 /DNA_ID=CAMNT_0016256343 /DNA_START=573 /DNA_END=2452 /DNA_ORIENTATION=-
MTSTDEFYSADVEVVLNLTDASSNEYDLLSKAVSILPASTTRPAPQLVEAKFSDSGVAMFVSFGAATDKAKITSNSFSCSLVLNFTGHDFSDCTWVNTTTIKATFPSASAATVLAAVGDNIFVLNETVRALCVAGTVCADYPTTLIQSTPLLVPNSPVQPTVVVSLPSKLSACQDILLDATLSTGNAGRDWESVSWVVFSAQDSDTAANIESFLNLNVSDITQTVTIPASLFTSAGYSFSLTLMNAFGASGSATVLFELASNPNLPSLTILGSSSVRIKPSEALEINTRVELAPCSESPQLSYVWTALSNGVVKTVTSVSNDPAAFILAPNTFSSGEVYEITVEVTAAATATNDAISTSASVSVSVIDGDVVVVIRGGTTRLLGLPTEFSLDSSRSYDENFATIAEASLNYSWSCSYATASLFGQSCDDVFGNIDRTTSVVTISGASLDTQYEYDFDVIVTAPDTRSSSQIINVQLNEDSSSTQTIITTTTQKVNANDQVTLVGFVQANYAIDVDWSASIDGAEISFNALTPISSTFTAAEVANLLTVPVSIPGGSFPEGSDVTFTLNANAQGQTNSAFQSFSSIIVAINSPPKGGTFSVTPSSGNALSTNFEALTTGWSDDAVDFP